MKILLYILLCLVGIVIGLLVPPRWVWGVGFVVGYVGALILFSDKLY